MIAFGLPQPLARPLSFSAPSLCQSPCPSPRSRTLSHTTPRGRLIPTTVPAVALRDCITRLAGAERGIFRLDTAKRAEILSHIAAAEEQNPCAAPAAENASAAAGAWRLLYTTLTILGRRRVALAIGTADKPGFVSLGEFYQVVDCAQGESRSIVVFRMVLGGEGTFTIRAGYESISDSVVAVETTSAVLAPKKLEQLLGPNIALLEEIFDPTGLLDITYLDMELRIGRDNKGNVFVLERCDAPKEDVMAA